MHILFFLYYISIIINLFVTRVSNERILLLLVLLWKEEQWAGSNLLIRFKSTNTLIIL